MIGHTSNIPSLNYYTVEREVLKLNGLNFSGSLFLDLSQKNSSVLIVPEHSTVVILVSVYLVCGVLSIAVVFFLLDKLHDEEKKERPPMFRMFFATLRHVKDTRMLLIIPLTMYSGLEQGFVFADFTKVGYIVSCLMQYILTIIT
jgi:hypothetical protein